MKLSDITDWFAKIRNVPWGLHIINVSDGKDSGNCHAVSGRAYSNYDPDTGYIPDGKSDARYVCGGIFRSVTTTRAPSFGIATEAWNFSDPRSDSGPLVNEVSVISQHPDKPFIRKRGLDVVFKNRPDSRRYKGIRGGKATNTYNTYANAIVISSQARSTEGEYCGWTAAIRLGPHALDWSAKQPFSAIIDYRSCPRDGNGDIPYRFVWKHEGVEYGELYDPALRKHQVWKHINTDRQKLIKEW